MRSDYKEVLVRKERSKVEPASGEGGIRTPDAGITDITVFETAAFNHSATSPRESLPPPLTPFNRLCATARTFHELAPQREAGTTLPLPKL
jgi:hypothetical protein